MEVEGKDRTDLNNEVEEIGNSEQLESSDDSRVEQEEKATESSSEESTTTSSEVLLEVSEETSVGSEDTSVIEETTSVTKEESMESVQTEEPLKETLSDDTVIAMSPVLLRGIREDVELVAKDQITIKELKKVRRISVISYPSEKEFHTLEGLQYAENLVSLLFIRLNDYDYYISDLTPLSNLEKLREIQIQNSKVTDLRPLKKWWKKLNKDFRLRQKTLN